MLHHGVCSSSSSSSSSNDYVVNTIVVRLDR